MSPEATEVIEAINRLAQTLNGMNVPVLVGLAVILGIVAPLIVAVIIGRIVLALIQKYNQQLVSALDLAAQSAANVEVLRKALTALRDSVASAAEITSLGDALALLKETVVESFKQSATTLQRVVDDALAAIQTQVTATQAALLTRLDQLDAAVNALSDQVATGFNQAQVSREELAAAMLRLEDGQTILQEGLDQLAALAARAEKNDETIIRQIAAMATQVGEVSESVEKLRDELNMAIDRAA